MSAFHNSPAGEKFAMRAHQVWAFASLGQAIFALAAAWILYPIAMSALGLFGHYVFGLLLLLYAQVILGMGGMLFHLAGARDHSKALEALCKSQERGVCRGSSESSSVEALCSLRSPVLQSGWNYQP